MEHAKLIGHPMRARIITAVTRRQLTIGQIAEALSDVPLPSLYRHVRLLVEGGVLETVEEIRVNGALTKVYAVRQGTTVIRDAGEITPAEHLTYFSTFTELLNGSFQAYLGQEGADPAQDPLTARMTVLYLTSEEFRAFHEEIIAVFKRWGEQEPTKERTRLIAAHIVIPDRSDPSPTG